ncbi:MAG TPA: respiratory nitrate reductase subunit gamma [Terriglobia bacterium]|nr:respiratory nitrate reductase subunit gamma [Terriglobia bacterium]
MASTIIIYAILYTGALTFIVVSVVRAIRYARLPLHLRWELYPVPHEEKERVEHGGSYLETKDWWMKSIHFNLTGELKWMLAEILFLKGLWEFKRKTWYRSYPFHLGLYLLIGAAGILFFSAYWGIVAPAAWAGGTGTVLYYTYATLGLIGAGLTLLGAAGLLVERLTDEDLKTYTSPGDIFNLAFFIVTVGFLLAGYFLRPADSLSAFAIAQGTLTFDTKLQIPILLETGLVLGTLLTAYVPMTHMAHFIAKYFTYHSVRWSDKPNWKDSRLEAKLAKCLMYRPTWNASHVGADGVKTWAEIATTNPAQGGRK